MARTIVTVLTTYVLISSVKATFSIQAREGTGTLFFNDVTTDDETANKYRGEIGDQYIQTEDKDVNVRSDALGFKLMVDTVG